MDFFKFHEVNLLIYLTILRPKSKRLEVYITVQRMLISNLGDVFLASQRIHINHIHYPVDLIWVLIKNIPKYFKRCI